MHRYTHTLEWVQTDKGVPIKEDTMAQCTQNYTAINTLNIVYLSKNIKVRCRQMLSMTPSCTSRRPP